MMSFDLKGQQDESRVLNNPDKGWYVHYYDNGITKYGDSLAENDFLEDFPLMDHIYLRLAWSYLEPEEGKFNWEIIDKIIDPWVAHGYRISFRISCKEIGKNQAYATPKWVFDAGAKCKFIEYNETWEPDYGDSIFLEKLENFHRAFAERYESRPEVIYVDVGSYGDWGEGHCCFGSQTEWPVEVIKQHIDIYKRCYKNTLICVSDDIVTHREQTDVNGAWELLHYIEDNGLTVRDDSVCVDWFERFGYDTLRSGTVFDHAWRKYPTVLELAHFDHTIEKNTWHDGWPFLASVEGAHATYAGFHGDPRRWLNDNRELAGIMGNRLGYWYFLNRIDIDGDADALNIKCYFENRGSAPAYKNYHLCFKLVGDNEYTAQAEDFNSREMMPHVITVRNHLLKFGAKSGKYTLCVRMYDDADRTIELGFDEKIRSSDGYYALCDIEL